MLADIIARQEGVITLAQAKAAGMTEAAVRARVRSGRWQRLHRGVFATFSGPVPPAARRWAALLAVGADGTLSHRSAAEANELCEPARSGGPIHVTVAATRRVVKPRGVVVHRSSRIDEARHPVRQPPQTRVEETVLDLVDVARTVGEAEGWIVRACARRLTKVSLLREAMDARKRVRFREPLTGLLAEVAEGCHSPLELGYRRSVEQRHQLPTADRQVKRHRRGGVWYDDVTYPDHKVIVELDGSVAHPAEKRGLERKRDNAAALEGYTVLRYGLAEITEDACGTADEVGRMLRRNGWKGTPVPCGPHCPIARHLQ